MYKGLMWMDSSDNSNNNKCKMEKIVHFYMHR